MSIVAARIDNRLLHGIVATQWTPTYNPERVMIIDDHTANNPVLKDGMRMSKPAGVALSVINREVAYTNFKNGKYDNQKVFVVVADPQVLLDLLELGVSIPKIVLGGTPTPDAGEYKRVSSRAYVLKEQEDIYRNIMSKGTKVVCQYVPADKEEPLNI